jgi:mannitol-specific phosphotransferase system IIBC component
MEQPPKKKFNIQVIVGIITTAIVSIIVQQYFFKTPSYDEAIKKAATEINKTCPLMVDTETRLDSVEAFGRTLQYNYTLVNMEKVSVDTTDLKNFLEPTILNNIKTSPELKYYRDCNATLAYLYLDKNKQRMLKISITPDRYKTP